jgi:hypothetical protein
LLGEAKAWRADAQSALRQGTLSEMEANQAQPSRLEASGVATHQPAVISQLADIGEWDRHSLVPKSRAITRRGGGLWRLA